MEIFTDIIPIQREKRTSKDYNANSILIGDGGELGFKVDKSGVWMGGRQFGDASFSVDMAGNGKFRGTLVAGSIIEDPNFSFSGGGNSMTDMGSGGTVTISGVTHNTRNVKVGSTTYKFLIQ